MIEPVISNIQHLHQNYRVSECLYMMFYFQLAILGACRCRIISPNPCGCAHAAANLKKEVVRYKQEVSTLLRRINEVRI